ncbi:MAG: DUF4142 domain-containing protein [Kiloniellaceae bacterium]
MKNQLLRATAIVALALVPSVAMSQSSGTSTEPQNSPAQAEEMQVSQSDSEFVKQAAAGGKAEIELGRLATEQSKNEEVTAFGETLVDDHTQASDKLKELASQKGIDLSGDLSAEGEQAKQRLSEMSGPDFDRAFIEQMVTDHERTIDLFEQEVEGGTDADLKAFAENTLPTLREHLDEAQRIETSLSQESAMQTADSNQPMPAASGDAAAGASAGAGTTIGTENGGTDQVAESQENMTGDTAGDLAAGKTPGEPTARFQAALGEVTAKDLIGKTVVNASGDEVGEIDDIVIDDADVVSAVVSVGGFLGIGAKQVAVPFDDLTTGEGDAIWQTNATEEELKSMPAYQKGDGGFLSYPLD